MKKVTVWIYVEQYKGLTRLPLYNYGISTTIRQAIQEYLKNHSTEMKHPTTPEFTNTHTSDTEESTAKKEKQYLRV